MSCNVALTTSYWLLPMARMLGEMFGGCDCWAITGSANLAIRGEMVRPSDIDIITTRESADTLARTSKIVRFAFKYSVCETIKSYYASAALYGMHIDVMADAAVMATSGTWVCLDDWRASVQYAEIGGCLVPLTSLDFERRVFSLLGNTERVMTIDSALRRTLA